MSSSRGQGKAFHSLLGLGRPAFLVERGAGTGVLLSILLGKHRVGECMASWVRNICCQAYCVSLSFSSSQKPALRFRCERPRPVLSPLSAVSRALGGTGGVNHVLSPHVPPGGATCSSKVQGICLSGEPLNSNADRHQTAAQFLFEADVPKSQFGF
jgi:hypothetical protein